MAAGRPVLLLLAIFATAVSGVKVTPVEKVIELLKKLEVKITEEGKEEAAAYDKYACFCKEQASDKLYAIEKSQKKIEELDAKIEALDAEIDALDKAIGKLSTLITDLKANITTAEDTRAGEHDTYLTEEAKISGAISACERAIEALKESKGNMEGKTDMEVELVQVRPVALLAISTNIATRKSKLTESQWKMLADIASAQPGSGEAYQYEYHSNDIIATLESLLSQFKGNKEELDQTEFETNSAFEKKRLGLQNQKKFAEKEKKEKEAEMEAKTEEKNKAEEDKTQETAEMTSDTNFLKKVLTPECQEKARLFDQRSKMRANEITAITDAMKALEDGVAPNWQANKKLNGLVQTKAVPKGHWVYVEDAPQKAAAKPHSFIQLRSRNAGKVVADKAQSFLMEQARQLKSPVLSAIALKVKAQEDHFVKVRSIIKDLLARLEAEAADEASQKSMCDKEMKAAIDSRDEEQSKVEETTAQISGKEAEKQKLTEEIATLSKEIAENKKALNEATQLREEEKAENEKTVADAGAGKDAVTMALQFLRDFYEGAAFLQQKGKYVPPNADREGNTVADLAPEVFDSEYKGAQESSKGIIGMLEVILSDFERTVDTVEQEETDAADEFTTFKTDNEADTKLKEDSITTKEGQISTLADDLVTLEDQLGAAKKALKLALDELETLHTMCVAGEETYAERVEKRNKEIAALKEAHGILENWQG